MSLIRYNLMGTEQLANELRRKSETDYRKVERKNILQLRNRAVSSSEPSRGGTPVDTRELQLSANANSAGDTFGYTKDYAPHVEFGHRTRGGGYIGGQYYLRTNVEIQQPIFRQDLINEMRK